MSREISVKQFEYLMAINKAHLIMLVEQNLISQENAAKISRAILDFDMEALPRSEETGELLISYLVIEKQLIERAGEMAGNLHIARSNNDIGLTTGRMTLREKLLNLISADLQLQNSLISFAEKHIETITIGYTHTQHGQPTTIAHYIMAVADVINRDIIRFKAAYANCNRSSMGAAAITTSGFPINRERVAQLLSFDEVAENSYDAIGGADHVGEVATAVELAAVNLGRFVQDLLLWCTQEFNVLWLSDKYVGGSSIMPQKRNPGALENMRANLSGCAGNAATVLLMMHNTPYGDIGDIKATPQSNIWNCLESLEKIYGSLSNIILSMEINKEVLKKRTEESFCVVTELADTLVRTEDFSFRTAHHITAGLVRNAQAQGLTANQVTLSQLNEAAQEVIGRKVKLDEESFRKALDPVHFVNTRSRQGGPCPDEVYRMIVDRKKLHKENCSWIFSQREKWEQALQNLDSVIREWGKKIL